MPLLCGPMQKPRFASPCSCWAMHFLNLAMQIAAFAKLNKTTLRSSFADLCSANAFLFSANLRQRETPPRTTILCRCQSLPCFANAIQGDSLPKRTNATLCRCASYRIIALAYPHLAFPVPIYSLPRRCYTCQFPCVTLIRPAIAMHFSSIADQRLSLP